MSSQLDKTHLIHSEIDHLEQTAKTKKTRSQVDQFKISDVKWLFQFYREATRLELLVGR